LPRETFVAIVWRGYDGPNDCVNPVMEERYPFVSGVCPQPEIVSVLVPVHQWVHERCVHIRFRDGREVQKMTAAPRWAVVISVSELITS
jgi:hypothetical protein